MKKTVSALVIAVAALTSVPAFAQATGTVVVNGTVAAKCSAVQPISGSIALGELAKDNGTIDKAFSKATNGLSTNFTVLCNGANPQLKVEARPLINSAASEVIAGYTNKVHYTAKLSALGAKGSTATVSDQSLSNGATAALIGDRLKPVANNVTLTIADGVTEDSAAILEAGAYSGTVDITIAPAA